MAVVDFNFNFNSTPFNENTFLGWATVFCLHLIVATAYGIVNIPASAFFLAVGLYFEACTHHFQTIFADTSKVLNEKPTIETMLKVKKSLIEAVHFHIFTKRYSFMTFKVS